MGLVIDTNIFIDAEQQRFDLARLADYGEYGGAYMAAVTASELLAGVHLATTQARRLKRSAFVEHLLANIPVLDFTQEVARSYAVLYAQFVRQRDRANRNVHDLQIAATALTHGYAVLTSNRDDFRPIEALTVESPT